MPGDEMSIDLFDVVVDDELLGPREFVKLFVDRVKTAPFIGRLRWTRGFVREVFEGNIGCPTLEGFVGKGVRGEMAKAKTRAWIEAIRARYTSAEAEKLINS